MLNSKEEDIMKKIFILFAVLVISLCANIASSDSSSTQHAGWFLFDLSSRPETVVHYQNLKSCGASEYTLAVNKAWLYEIGTNKTNPRFVQKYLNLMYCGPEDPWSSTASDDQVVTSNAVLSFDSSPFAPAVNMTVDINQNLIKFSDTMKKSQ
jgi:hypothetical protein